MRRLILLLVVTSACGVTAFAQSQSKCFQYGALKDKHIFRFEADGGDVAGSYFVEREYDAGQTETYDFVGTRDPLTAHTLSIKFSNYRKLPNPPFELRRATLTLVMTGGVEKLRAKFFGNGRAPVYALDLESCEPSYAALVKRAKRVAFARGESSASVSNPIAPASEQASFLLSVRKGQYVGVFAPGCAVNIYFPNGELYKYVEAAGTERDTTTSLDALAADLPVPQSGDVLFMLMKGGPHSLPRKATFFVTATGKELGRKMEQTMEQRY